MGKKPSTTERGLGSEWIKLTVEARRIYEPICHLCRKEIDLDLDPNDRMSWTLDHLDPRGTHGTACPPLERTRPAHRACNSRKGMSEAPFARRWPL